VGSIVFDGLEALTEPRFDTNDHSPRINLRVVQSF